MENKTFVSGVFIEKPSEKAPAFVKENRSYKVAEFCKFLMDNENAKGYVNTVVKESKNGKLYEELNSWVKPEEVKEVKPVVTRGVPLPDGMSYPPQEISPDDIPF